MAKRQKGSKTLPDSSGAPPPVPKLSHLQFLVLGILLGSERRGLEIRNELAAFGVKKTGPAFYQVMARLEDAELVQGRYRQEIVEGQIIRERAYKISSTGEHAWHTCRDFQLSVIDRWGARAGGAHA